MIYITKKIQYGNCAICGKECELSYEHIPPKSAFNAQPVKTITGESFLKLMTSSDRKPWEYEGLYYQNQQKGLGLYSLCENCNNYTGSAYGNEYSKIAKDSTILFLNQEHLEDAEAIHFKIKEFYPLRFIKQVLSMLCSTTEGLTKAFPEIREVLLDKDKVLNDPKFKIHMFMIKTQIRAWTGINAMIIKGIDKPVVVSEIDAFPFGFLFDYDKEQNHQEMVNITSFLSFAYDERCEMECQLPIYERNVPFPLDFRTKEQVNETINDFTI